MLHRKATVIIPFFWAELAGIGITMNTEKTDAMPPLGGHGPTEVEMALPLESGLAVLGCGTVRYDQLPAASVRPMCRYYQTFCRWST